MLRKGSRDLAHLLDAAWPVHGQAFVVIQSDGSARRTRFAGGDAGRTAARRRPSTHRNALGLTGSRCHWDCPQSAHRDPGGASGAGHDARTGRLPLQGGLGMEIGAHLRIDEHRGPLIHDIEHFTTCCCLPSTSGATVEASFKSSCQYLIGAGSSCDSCRWGSRCAMRPACCKMR